MTLVQASIRRAVMSMGRFVVETVYPKTCAGCGMRGSWLCEVCDEDTLPLDVPGMCGRCGVSPITGRCSCGDLPSTISIARSVAVYDGWVAQAVHRVKYENEPDRARHLAERMAPVLGALGSVDMLVPVPLHPRKQRKRGFNQSALIAAHLSRLTGVPTLDIMRRTVDTVSQTTLGGRQRRENVRDAFTLDPTWAPAAGRRYVIIDDVRTTGATLGACADVLATTLPASIAVLTFAKDLQREDLQAYRAHVRSGVLPTP